MRTYNIASCSRRSLLTAAVTSESSLETAGCLQRTFAGDSQLKYIDGIWTNKINN